jgi:hypothetical protein
MPMVSVVNIQIHLCAIVLQSPSKISRKWSLNIMSSRPWTALIRDASHRSKPQCLLAVARTRARVMTLPAPRDMNARGLPSGMRVKSQRKHHLRPLHRSGRLDHAPLSAAKCTSITANSLHDDGNKRSPHPHDREKSPAQTFWRFVS